MKILKWIELFFSKNNVSIYQNFSDFHSIRNLEYIIAKARKRLNILQTERELERLQAQEEIFGEAAELEELKVKAEQWDLFNNAIRNEGLGGAAVEVFLEIENYAKRETRKA